VIESPLNIGNNGYWPAASTLNKTILEDVFDDVKHLEICFSGSGAVTFIEFQVCNEEKEEK
jgi:hypothetical protein